MNNKIKSYLEKLEQEKNVEILLACETGSRAWGFPSPDSDYDVRLIYKHELNWYLGLGKQKDSIEMMLDDNEIDISAWDLRKSLQLLWKSNAALLERIQSPIIYKKNDEFLSGFLDLANKAYSKIATLHHYLSMAKKGLEALQENENYKLKQFFYALRASVICLWILEKDELPPIEFLKAIQGLQIEQILVNRIHELIQLKATVSEKYLHNGESELIEFMVNSIKKAEQSAQSLPSSGIKTEELNAFFIQTLRKHEH